MRNTIAVGLIALSIGAGSVVPAVAASTQNVKLPASVSRPCKYEDSVNCSWNAGKSGNHKGHSFIVRKMPGKKGLTCVIYVAKADAHWDNCSR